MKTIDLREQALTIEQLLDLVQPGRNNEPIVMSRLPKFSKLRKSLPRRELVPYPRPAVLVRKFEWESDQVNTRSP